MCYQHEVRKRRIPFQEDKETLEKIEKAAKWLTGDYNQTLHLVVRIIDLISFNPVFCKVKCLIQRIIQLFIITRSQQQKNQDSGKNLYSHQ